MFGIGFPELVMILAVALIVLGPQRLPEVARMLGRAYAQLRRASEEFQQTIRQDLAVLERQEDANRNKAVAQEIRERCADVEDVQTAVIQVYCLLWAVGQNRRGFAIARGAGGAAAQSAAADYRAGRSVCDLY